MDILETERLIIRRFNEDDWKDLYEYLSKEDVVKFEPYDVCTEDECKEIAKGRSKNKAFWAVCLKENNKLIGNLYFEKQEPDEFETWELGYVFNSEYQKKGYATESCKIFLAYAFEELNVRRIIAKCNPKNASSWKLLERLNMRREGHSLQTAFFKRDEKGNPIWHDTYQYAILSSEWQQL